MGTRGALFAGQHLLELASTKEGKACWTSLRPAHHSFTRDQPLRPQAGVERILTAHV